MSMWFFKVAMPDLKSDSVNDRIQNKYFIIKMNDMTKVFEKHWENVLLFNTSSFF